VRIDIVSENVSPWREPSGEDSFAQQSHVHQLATALAGREHTVTLWTRRDSLDVPDEVVVSEGFRIRYLDAGPPRPVTEQERAGHLPALAAALRAGWHRDRPDVVHAHYWSSGMAALPVARDIGVPVVQTFHSLGGHGRPLRPQTGCMPGRLRVERSLTGLAGRLIATSSSQADELVQLGAPRRRVRVVPHGVNTDEFNPSGPALTRGDRSRVVLTGPLEPQLGVDDAVLALAAVPEAELVLAGNFGPRDRNQTRLLDLAVRRRVAGRLHLLPQLPGDRMPQLLRSADVVVCVPWHERFGVVALEAMACARPVVASPVGGLADTVVNGVTGAHVPPRRPDALASALRQVLGSPTMSQAFGIAGRDRVMARYRWNSIAESTMAIYQETVDEHRR